MPVVTGFGDAAAASAIVGPSFWIVTLAVPCTPEPGSVAVTVNGPPPLLPAVKRPPASMAPPPFTAQSKAGCAVTTSPNWSYSVAVKACVPCGSSGAEPGTTVALAASCWTSTVTWPVVENPSWSVTVTWKV